MADKILEVKNLYIEYPISIGTVQAVSDVSFDLHHGEAFGLVGESGCGKSTLGLSFLRLLRPPGRIASGEILYRGRDIVKMKDRELLRMRGQNIAMVFQNPLTSLNPLFRIDQHFVETIQWHEPGTKRDDAIARSENVLEDLGIEKKRLFEYPHQLSGGMRQRIMIGLGLIMNPDIIVADEPTTSLDVIVEAGFVDLLNHLRKAYNLSIILITHNLGLVAEIADRIAVMYGGRMAEIGTSEEIFHRPLHPYTQGLINCVPNIRMDQQALTTMPGSPPDLVAPPVGCPFADRCPHVMEICRHKMPPLNTYDNNEQAACWLHEDVETQLHPSSEA